MQRRLVTSAVFKGGESQKWMWKSHSRHWGWFLSKLTFLSSSLVIIVPLCSHDLRQVQSLSFAMIRRAQTSASSRGDQRIYFRCSFGPCDNHFAEELLRTSKILSNCVVARIVANIYWVLTLCQVLYYQPYSCYLVCFTQLILWSKDYPLLHHQIRKLRSRGYKWVSWGLNPRTRSQGLCP